MRGTQERPSHFAEAEQVTFFSQPVLVDEAGVQQIVRSKLHHDAVDLGSDAVVPAEDFG